MVIVLGALVGFVVGTMTLGGIVQERTQPIVHASIFAALASILGYILFGEQLYSFGMVGGVLGALCAAMYMVGYHAHKTTSREHQEHPWY